MVLSSQPHSLDPVLSNEMVLLLVRSTFPMPKQLPE